MAAFYNLKERMSDMGIAEGLEPRRVFEIFEELSRIPHGSGNTKGISDFIVDFARQRDIGCRQDSLNNVILVKEATPGYEAAPSIILQGHMDMVCEKEPGVTIDFLHEGLTLVRDGDWIRAEGTTLGGDDGIAVAYILALMEAKDLPHPRLEGVITVDEETGMDGAEGIDLSDLQGHLMLNLDSEEEGSLLAGCAGGARATLRLPLRREAVQGQKVTVRVEGLQGGHSGCEIHRQRGNANVLIGRLADAVLAAGAARLISVEGGLKDNAIPRFADAVLVTEDIARLNGIVDEWQSIFREELAGSDPEVSLKTEPGEVSRYAVLTDESADRLCTALMLAPNGVQGMSQFIPGLVETSLNLGILTTQATEAEIHFSVRSSVASAKEALLRRLALLAKSVGAECDVGGRYPAWPYRPQSPLRDRMVEVYEALYGKKPEVTTIHAGLECGLLAEKIPDLDCVSFGPDILDIHTSAERMNIASVQRTWQYIVKFLETVKEPL